MMVSVYFYFSRVELCCLKVWTSSGDSRTQSGSSCERRHENTHTHTQTERGEQTQQSAKSWSISVGSISWAQRCSIISDQLLTARRGESVCLCLHRIDWSLLLLPSDKHTHTHIQSEHCTPRNEPSRAGCLIRAYVWWVSSFFCLFLNQKIVPTFKKKEIKKKGFRQMTFIAGENTKKEGRKTPQTASLVKI